MRIGVLGINHKLAGLTLREKLAKTCMRRFSPGNAIHPDHFIILLSTCNRTEIYFSSDDLAATHSYLLNILRQEVEEEFDHKLYSYFLIDCFNHLARVTSGLDSAILGETEIQGQVKNAYDTTLHLHKLPQDMHFLFQKSLKIGKEVREKIQLGRGLPELEHAIFSISSHFFPDLNNASILFVGASEINWKVLHYLSHKGLKNISLCNRSSLPDIQTNSGIKTVDWSNLNQWKKWDLIIFGTKSQEYLIRKEEPLMVCTSKLVLDLSVPRNVDPLLGREKNITLLNLEQINRTLTLKRQRSNHQFYLAEDLISSAVAKQFQIYAQKQEKRQQFSLFA